MAERIPIMASPRGRAGDEPGVNMNTGNPDPRWAGKVPPVTQERNRDAHNGIVFDSLYPGTDFVHPHSAPAWYERSAVHRAMEEKSGGAAVTPAQVAAHVAALRLLAAHPQGRALLGPALERYESATRALPEILPKTGTALLRGSGPDQRPRGATLDRLTELVHPLVGVANRLLANTGRAAAFPPAPLPPAKPLPYEVVPIHELAPMTLEPSGHDAPAEDRFHTIARLRATGMPVADIVHELTRPTGHGLTRRQAQATVRRWARGHAARVALGMEPGPERLARRRYEASEEGIKPTDVSGTLVVPRGETNATGGTDALVAHRHDDRIEGTSLAYHLHSLARKYRVASPAIASLARTALMHRDDRGQTVPGGTYATLGRMLKKARDPLAGAYNWHRIEDKLSLDERVRKFIEKNVVAKEGSAEKKNKNLFWDSIVRRFGTDKGAQISPGHVHNELWRRIRNEFGDSGGKLLAGDPAHPESGFLRNIQDSMHRIADRYLDRAYLKAVSKDRSTKNKPDSSHVKGDPLFWRDVIATPRSDRPAKFSREESNGVG